MTRRPIPEAKTVARLAGVLLLALGGGAAGAAPLTLLDQWEGGMDYFATGAPLAVDGPDGDTTTVDTLSQPASVVVSSADIPATATVVAAYLYWAGTIPDQSECANTQYTDDEVLLTLPGAAAAVPVTADQCQCIPGATSYDIQACRKDITPLVVASGMQGTFTVDEFAARAQNGATDNASFSLVLVYEEADLLPPRRIALYDGLEELYQGSRVMQLAGLEVDNPAQGDITWYVLDGDVGGVGPEEVRVQGQPGGLSTAVWDMVNPFDNPMNRTINTTQPPQTGILGVDIDRLDISAGLTPLDTSVNMTYTAGEDKFWVVYNLVGVNVYRPVVNPKSSSKTWTLQVDADGSTTITEGDTVRYTIHLSNSGTAPGYVGLTDPIPPEFASWQLVDDGGGVNQSTATTLMLENLWLPVGGAVDVVLDAIIGPGAAGTSIVNGALWEVVSSGTTGAVVAPPVAVVSGSTPDAGVPDASLPDGGSLDGGALDAGDPDGGTSDGGGPDALVQDAAVTDASTGLDAGEDAGPDAGPGLDSGPGADAQDPPGTAPVGCRCQGAGGAPDPGILLLWLLVFALLWRRSRGRSDR